MLGRRQQDFAIDLMAAHFGRDGSSFVMDAGAAEGGRFAILDKR
jgi:hypothetical protein